MLEKRSSVLFSSSRICSQLENVDLHLWNGSLGSCRPVPDLTGCSEDGTFGRGGLLTLGAQRTSWLLLCSPDAFSKVNDPGLVNGHVFVMGDGAGDRMRRVKGIEREREACRATDANLSS